MGGRGLGRGRLQFPDPSVHAGLADQFLVGSLLGDPARVEHQDAIRLLEDYELLLDSPVPKEELPATFAGRDGAQVTPRLISTGSGWNS